MILNLYSVLDEKAQAFGSMFFKKNHGEAIRYFGDACTDSKTMLYQHPEDFSLYFHGKFNDETGYFEAVTPIQYISRATEFKDINGKIKEQQEVTK